ncbi:Uncharacterized protein PBTT_02298 [Plasmodiophora brassicae]
MSDVDDDNVLAEDLDLETARDALRRHIWESYWSDTFARPEFNAGSDAPQDRIKRFSVKPKENNAAAAAAAASTSESNSASEYDWRHQAFPPLAPEFNGSIGDRHQETIIVFNSLGPALFKRVVETSRTREVADLFTRVAQLEGVDVFWSGHVSVKSDNDDDVMIAKPSSSKTKFGSLRVCRFPFAAEFSFDDTTEVTMFSLARSLEDESLELLLADLQQLVDENVSETVQNLRRTRQALRCLASAGGHIEVIVSKTFGSGSIRGQVKILTKPVDESSAPPASGVDLRPGFNVALISTKLVSTTGLACKCLFPKGDVLLMDLLSSDKSKPLDLECQVVCSIVDAIPEARLSQFLSRYAGFRAKLNTDAIAREATLPLTFYIDIYADDKIDLDALIVRLEERYPKVHSKLIGNGVDQALLECRIALNYLERCSRPELFWFLFWIDCAEQYPDRIPDTIVIDACNIDSIVYKHWMAKSLADLQEFGFDKRTVENDNLFVTFWARLEDVRSKAYYKNSNGLQESVATVRMECARLGYDPDRVSSNGTQQTCLTGIAESVHAPPARAPAEPLASEITISEPEGNPQEDLSPATSSPAAPAASVLSPLMPPTIPPPMMRAVSVPVPPSGESDDNLDDIGIVENKNASVSDKNDSEDEPGAAGLDKSEKKQFGGRVTSASLPVYDTDNDDHKMKVTIDRMLKFVNVVGGVPNRSLAGIAEDEDGDDPGIGRGKGETSDPPSSDWSDKEETEESSESDPGITREASDADSMSLQQKGSLLTICIPEETSGHVTRIRSTKRGRLVPPSPVARVHQLDTMRALQKKSLLMTIMGRLVPECGPGRPRSPRHNVII